MAVVFRKQSILLSLAAITLRTIDLKFTNRLYSRHKASRPRWCRQKNTDRLPSRNRRPPCGRRRPSSARARSRNRPIWISSVCRSTGRWTALSVWDCALWSWSVRWCKSRPSRTERETVVFGADDRPADGTRRPSRISSALCRVRCADPRTCAPRRIPLSPLFCGYHLGHDNTVTARAAITRYLRPR